MAATAEPNQIDLVDMFSAVTGIYFHKPGCHYPLGEQCAECCLTETSNWYNKYEYIRKYFGLPFLQHMESYSYVDEQNLMDTIQTKWIAGINKYCATHELHFRVKDITKNDCYIFLMWHKVYFTYLNEILEDNLNATQYGPIE